MFSIVLLLTISRRGGEIGETDDDTQSGSATDIIGTSEVRWIIQSFMIDLVSYLHSRSWSFNTKKPLVILGR